MCLIPPARSVLDAVDDHGGGHARSLVAGRGGDGGHVRLVVDHHEADVARHVVAVPHGAVEAALAQRQLGVEDRDRPRLGEDLALDAEHVAQVPPLELLDAQRHVATVLRPARPGRSCSWRPPHACREERPRPARLAVLPPSIRARAMSSSAAGGGKARPGAAALDAGHRLQHVGVAQRAVAHGVHRRAGEPAERGRRGPRARTVRRRGAPSAHGPAVSTSCTAANTSPRRASTQASTRPRQPAAAAPAVRMSRLVAPTIPMPSDWASPLAAATPTRRPVKSPGPMSTATTPRSPGTRSSWVSRCSKRRRQGLDMATAAGQRQCRPARRPPCARPPRPSRWPSRSPPWRWRSCTHRSVPTPSSEQRGRLVRAAGPAAPADEREHASLGRRRRGRGRPA